MQFFKDQASPGPLLVTKTNVNSWNRVELRNIKMVWKGTLKVPQELQIF